MSGLYCLDARTARPHFPGIGRYTAALARALATQLGAGEALVLLRERHQSLPWAEGGASTLPTVEAMGSPFSLRQHWAVPRLLRRVAASVYHSPYYLMPLWPGVPTVVTVHDLIPLRCPRHFPRRHRLAFRLAVGRAVRRAAAVVAVSQATAADLERFLGLGRERITVIPEAADPQLLAASPADERVRAALPHGYVLYVGSNKPHKNLPRLIDAWARLQPQPLPLVVAGPWDPRHPEARRRVERLGLGSAVRFLGPVADTELGAWYRSATAFVFPSEWEGFGLPVIEAMACGAPVACSRAGALPEVVGDGAVLFDPGDVDSIAAALSSLLSDDRHRREIGRRGAARARQLSWERAAEQTLALYRRLLQARC